MNDMNDQYISISPKNATVVDLQKLNIIVHTTTTILQMSNMVQQHQ